MAIKFSIFSKNEHVYEPWWKNFSSYTFDVFFDEVMANVNRDDVEYCDIVPIRTKLLKKYKATLTNSYELKFESEKYAVLFFLKFT